MNTYRVAVSGLHIIFYSVKLAFTAFQKLHDNLALTTDKEGMYSGGEINQVGNTPWHLGIHNYLRTRKNMI